MSYPVPGVMAVIRDSEGKVLLRNAFAGAWELPRAALAGGECWEDSLRALVRNTAGAGVGEFHLLGIYSGVGGDGPSLVAVFVVRSLTGPARLQPEACWQDSTASLAGATERAVIRDLAEFRGDVFVR